MISASDVEHLPVRGPTGLHRAFRHVTVTRSDPVEMSGHQYLSHQESAPRVILIPISRDEETIGTLRASPFDSARRQIDLSCGRSRTAASRNPKKLIRTSGIECTSNGKQRVRLMRTRIGIHASKPGRINTAFDVPLYLPAISTLPLYPTSSENCRKLYHRYFRRSEGIHRLLRYHHSYWQHYPYRFALVYTRYLSDTSRFQRYNECRMMQKV